MHLLKKAAPTIFFFRRGSIPAGAFTKKLTRFSYILLILCAVKTAEATTITNDGNITGKITDKATGLPILGVTISIPDLRASTSTDANGILCAETTA